MKSYQTIRTIIYELTELHRYTTDSYACLMILEAIDSLSEAYKSLRETTEQEDDN